MCVPLPHEQDTNSADTAYEIVCLRILDLCVALLENAGAPLKAIKIQRSNPASCSQR
jgi:hypothetical protein